MRRCPVRCCSKGRGAAAFDVHSLIADHGTETTGCMLPGDRARFTSDYISLWPPLPDRDCISKRAWRCDCRTCQARLLIIITVQTAAVSVIAQCSQTDISYWYSLIRQSSEWILTDMRCQSNTIIKWCALCQMMWIVFCSLIRGSYCMYIATVTLFVFLFLCTIHGGELWLHCGTGMFVFWIFSVYWDEWLQ